MSGLLLLGVVVIWIAVVAFVAKRLSRLFKPGAVRNIVVAIATAVMLVLPVADELISAPQFYKLCEEAMKLQFDPERIRGKTIIFVAENTPPSISVGFLRGYYLHWRYLDAVTREELITEKIYHLNGGILIRSLKISETNAPLTMRSYCGPSEHPTQKNFLTRYNLKYVERREIE